MTGGIDIRAHTHCGSSCVAISLVELTGDGVADAKASRVLNR